VRKPIHAKTHHPEYPFYGDNLLTGKGIDMPPYSSGQMFKQAGRSKSPRGSRGAGYKNPSTNENHECTNMDGADSSIREKFVDGSSVL
jgi:hypothetical protein